LVLAEAVAAAGVNELVARRNVRKFFAKSKRQNLSSGNMRHVKDE